MKSDRTLRRGRPPAGGKTARGDYVGFRSPRELKKQLELVAASAGRSLSTETQFRLVQSLRAEAALDEALHLAFGEGAQLLLLIGRALRAAPPLAGLSIDSPGWLGHATAYDMAARAIAVVVEALRPPGEVMPTVPDQIEGLTRALLLGLADPTPNTPLSAFASRSREALGPVIAERLVAWRQEYLARAKREDQAGLEEQP